ncbi:MAG: SLC13 family permease [Gammaproteobacteria bacterium]|nr:SLC13 family permease [Gammaproteobacteria bacterium]
MTQDQAFIIAILSATIAMFLWGRWRHDMVALGSLLACVLVGLLPGADAFVGFGHPAVITVACILVLSAGLQTSGAIDAVAHRVIPHSAGALKTIATITALAALLSAFMNNVGALALLIPVSIQIAHRLELPPGKVLMPVSFGSILGGMTTLIGTPPNLIVSDFRAQINGNSSFEMFDFSPVGLAVAIAGVIFVSLIGWRLVPPRQRAGTESFETSAYLTEVRIPEKSKAVDMKLRQLNSVLEDADAQVIGMIRGEVRVFAPNPFYTIHADDILLIQAEPENLASALSSLNLKLEEDVHLPTSEESKSKEQANQIKSKKSNNNDKQDNKLALESHEVTLKEFVVLPQSELSGRSASDIRLRTRYGINLLAISREGRHSMQRLRTTKIKKGDVILMQGSPLSLSEFAAQFDCVPLAERPIYIPNKRHALIAVCIMTIAVGVAALGLIPTAISFSAAVFAAVGLRIVSMRMVYRYIDWPVIVLLAALIPVAGVMANTGAADLIAKFLLENVAQGHVVIALTIILVVSMTLSDFMNNAATAAVMCPIAIGTANNLGVNSDPFLMSVAIGASCAFLTPIGHQNNTLILGPGGFKFGDYWRLGLPLEILVVMVGVPMILLIWPLTN